MRLLDTNVLAKWGDPNASHEVVPYLQTHADDQFVNGGILSSQKDSQQVHAWLGTVLDGIEPFTSPSSNFSTST